MESTLVVHITNAMSVGKRLDKTWWEIYEAFRKGSVVVAEGETAGSTVYSVAWLTIGGYRVDYDDYVPYVVMLNGEGGEHKFETAAANGYPEESYN